MAEIVGGGTPSTNNSEYWDGDIDWYAPAEIGEQIYVDSSERKITKLGLEKSSAKMLPAHKTVLFTSRAGIGNTAILRTPAATNQGFQSMVLHDDINPYFVYSMTDMIKAKAERVASGSTFAEISGKMLGNLEFMFPSKAEQDKIGAYFEQMDNLITLHQCLDIYYIPKVRIYNIISWEQRKFGDVGSVAMCKRIFKEQTSEEGDIPFYKIGTFGGTPDAYISRELFEEYKKAYQYPSKGDILISASGSIGRTVEYTGEDEYFQDSNIVWLKHGDDIDNSFLKVLYSVVEWSCEGSTIKRLYNDNFLKTEFMLPDIKEQIKIGEYFGQFDNLITLHQCLYISRNLPKLTK